MALIILDRSIKPPEVTSNNNRVLINYLVRKANEREYHRGSVYLSYVNSALFYCKEDLQIIRQLFNYKNFWMDCKVNELSKSHKWRQYK